MMIQRIGYLNTGNVNFGLKTQPTKDAGCKSVPAAKITTENLAGIQVGTGLSRAQIIAAHEFLEKNTSELSKILKLGQVQTDTSDPSAPSYNFKNAKFDIRLKVDGRSSFIYFAVRENNSVTKLELTADQIRMNNSLVEDFENLQNLLEAYLDESINTEGFGDTQEEDIL